MSLVIALTELVVGDGTAVLIRALEPTEGLHIMQENRGLAEKGDRVKHHDLCNGPSKLTKVRLITAFYPYSCRASRMSGLYMYFTSNEVCVVKVGTACKCAHGHMYILRGGGNICLSLRTIGLCCDQTSSVHHDGSVYELAFLTSLTVKKVTHTRLPSIGFRS